MPAQVTLKKPKDFSLIGKPLRRVDSPDKVKGATQFGIDVQVPGMKIAAVMACPTFGGTLVSIDDRRTRSVPGVLEVIRIANAVAVIGEHFWAARQGLEALTITWDRGLNAGLTTGELWLALAESSRSGRSIIAREVGTRPGTGKLIEALYQLPMLAHATMEPLNTTVHVTPEKCEIWVGTQVPTRCVSIAAQITGLPESKVVLHNQYLGGGFGRRLETDSVEQAVAIAKQVSYPLKIIWTREQDIRHDIPRPMYYDRISAVLGSDGRPLWYEDHIAGASVLARWAPPAMGKDGMDDDLIECGGLIPYGIPNLRVEWVRHDMPAGLIVGWWRGVGMTHNAFMVEGFIDELAAAGGKDPVELRRRLLTHNLFVVESFVDELAHTVGLDPLTYRRSLLQNNPRTLALLNLAAEKIGWGQPLGARIGRGIALGEPFGSRVCLIVETEVTPQGELRLRRAVVALDCGVAINPSSVEAQIQGGVLFGLSAAMYSGITLKQGAIEQSNFHDYRTLRINETPLVEVHRIANEQDPGGLGEVGTAIAAPALANAVFAATGVRLRALPIDRSLLVRDAAALKEVIVDTSVERRIDSAAGA